MFVQRLLVIALILNACSPDPDKTAQPRPEPPPAESLRRQFIKANQQLVQKENDEMDFYASSHKMAFTRTTSGVRYYVYKPSSTGDSIRPGMKVKMEYRVMLLDGTLCYSSETEGPRTVLVEEDNIESGIHRGLQYLKKGDHALLLIPSHLAHGLLGDMKKIPPQMPIVYDVRLAD